MYVFSVNADGGKVAHANYVPEDARDKGFDARTWAAKVSEVLGGKVRPSKGCVIGQVDNISFQAGGKEDGAQGVGINVGEVENAVRIAQEAYPVSK